jgi:hypothetical protein
MAIEGGDPDLLIVAVEALLTFAEDAVDTDARNLGEAAVALHKNLDLIEHRNRLADA